MRRPHPLFWLTLVLLAGAVAVAATVDGRAPGYALNSGAVYRLEVALAVLVGAYAVCSLLGLAFEGRPLQRFELLGGAAAEESAEPLGQAARGTIRAMTRRANSSRIAAYLQRSRVRRSEMKRSGDEVERNLRKASTVLRGANGNGRSKVA